VRARQLVLHLGDGLGRPGWFADQLAELGQAWLPLLRGEQVSARVGVAAGAGHEHIARSQPVPQSQHGAHFPVVPERGFVPALAGLGQVAGVPGGHERGRRPGRDLPAAGPVQVLQDLHGVHQVAGAGPALEVDRVQHVRGELPEVGVGGLQRRQPAVVPGERFPVHCGDLAELVHPDPRPQHPAHVLVRDAHIDQHRQDHIHEQLAGLALPGPLGQGLIGPGLSLLFNLLLR